MLDNLLQAISRLVLRRPWFVLTIALLSTGLALFGARRVTLLTDLGQLLPKKGIASSNLRTCLERFATGDRLLVSITSPAGTGMNSEALNEAGSMLVERLRATGLFRSVTDRIDASQLIEAWRFGLDHLPALVEPRRHSELEARLSFPAMRSSLQQLRQRLLSPASANVKWFAEEDPLRLFSLLPITPDARVHGFEFDLHEGLFLSPDHSALLVVAEPIRAPFDINFSRRLMQRVTSEIQTVEAERAQRRENGSPSSSAMLEYHVAGGYRQAIEDEATMRHDLMLTAGVSLGGVLLFFWFVFRHWGVLFLVAIPLLVSACWTLGLASLLPGHLNAVTIGFAAILFGLGDDSALHIYGRFAEEVAGGAGSEEAIRTAILRTGRAIVAANLTTAVAFGLLLFTGFQALAELALLALYGIAGLMVSMLILLPALLTITSKRWQAGGTGGWAGIHLPIPGLERVMKIIVAHPWKFLGAALAMAMIALSLLPRVSFDFDLRRLRDPSSQALREEKVILDTFKGSTETVYLLYEAPDVDDALEHAVAIRPFLRQAARRGEILGASLPHPLLVPATAQRDAINAYQKQDLFRGSADRLREALSVEGFRVGRFERAIARLSRWENGEHSIFTFAPDEDDVSRWLARGQFQISQDRTWMAIAVHIPSDRRDSGLPQDLRDSVERAGFRIASLTEAVRETQRTVHRDFQWLSVTAPLLVMAVVWLLLGRSVAAILALLPMMYGVLGALTLSVLMDIPINTLTLIVVPLLFGLGVDYGVYMVHRHLDPGRLGLAPALAAVNRTLIVISATTFIAFASLCLANFRGLREIGLLMACGIATAIGACFIVLPAALAVLERRTGTKGRLS